MIAGLFYTTYAIPNGFFFNFYLTTAKWIGSIYLVYQALLMLVVSYKINDVLVHNY
jgi:hypothetical protein